MSINTWLLSCKCSRGTTVYSHTRKAVGGCGSANVDKWCIIVTALLLRSAVLILVWRCLLYLWWIKNTLTFRSVLVVFLCGSCASLIFSPGGEGALRGSTSLSREMNLILGGFSTEFLFRYQLCPLFSCYWMNPNCCCRSTFLLISFLFVLHCGWAVPPTRSFWWFLFTSLFFTRSVTKAQLKALWGRGVGHKIQACTHTHTHPHSPTWELQSTVTDFTLGTDEVIWPRQMWPTYTWISNLAVESVKNFTNTTMTRLLMFLSSFRERFENGWSKIFVFPTVVSDRATLRLPADAHLSNFNCLPTLSLCTPHAFPKRLSTLKVLKINAKINKIDSHANTETKVLMCPKSCC